MYRRLLLALLLTGCVVEPDDAHIDNDGDGLAAEDGDCDDEDASVGLATTAYADADGDGYGNPNAYDESCQHPSSYVDNMDDCDDGDADIHPDAAEVCDGEDNDCDGTADEDDAIDASTWYPDRDLDGYGGENEPSAACVVPSGYVSDGTDCDDGDPNISPDAAERCNETDDDCDEVVDEDLSYDWYLDEDGDGYGNSQTNLGDCDPPETYVADDSDCDDSDDTIHPDAPEVCDEVDNDCDGLTDDDDDSLDTKGLYTWYADADSDGFGDENVTEQSCALPSGYVADDSDCDDTSDEIRPDASEVCDDVDNDCDDTIDEDDAADAGTWYYDEDGDGYGNEDYSSISCDQPSGYVDNGEDCDDTSGTTHPGAAENDSSVYCMADADGDGYGDSDPDSAEYTGTDCDDTDSDISPNASEYCDEVDNDCDSDIDEDDADDALTWYRDDDGDGHGDDSESQLSCDQPSGFAANQTDCNDSDSDINPDSIEVCDEVDNDCNGQADDDDSGLDATSAETWYADSDGDGFGDEDTSTLSCEQPTGYVVDSTDCDDERANINTDADELCDGVDNDCDGATDEDSAFDASTWYADDDRDGYGDENNTTVSCDQPTGYVSNTEDCDDTSVAINIDATEVCDTVDNDCDGEIDEDDAMDVATWYMDGDSDGFGDADVSDIDCDQPSGYVADDTDCDDADDGQYPGADEICNDEDDDCDGDIDDDDNSVDSTTQTTWYADADGDGFGDVVRTMLLCDVPSDYVSNSTDCDDTDGTINTGASEVCDEVDNDCDGLTDDEDDSLDSSSGSTFYADSDGDGYGDPDISIETCAPPSNYVDISSDCDDDSDEVNPGTLEVCDSIDNDCDGDTDESDASDAPTWYADSDGDGYGDSDTSTAACEQPTDYVDDSTDCDDSDVTVNPEAVEVVGDSVDEDCDDLVVLVDEPFNGGEDGDNFMASNSSIYTCYGESCNSTYADCPSATGPEEEGVCGYFSNLHAEWGQPNTLLESNNFTLDFWLYDGDVNAGNYMGVAIASSSETLYFGPNGTCNSEDCGFGMTRGSDTDDLDGLVQTSRTNAWYNYIVSVSYSGSVTDVSLTVYDANGTIVGNSVSYNTAFPSKYGALSAFTKWFIEGETATFYLDEVYLYY